MMNYKKIIAGFCLITAFVFTTAFVGPGDEIVQKVATQLNKWESSNPPEKVYLQFDKPYYSVGDDIWFKAYITLGGLHRLSGLSGVLNVELLDDRDSVKQHIKLPVQSGLTWAILLYQIRLVRGITAYAPIPTGCAMPVRNTFMIGTLQLLMP